MTKELFYLRVIFPSLSFLISRAAEVGDANVVGVLLKEGANKSVSIFTVADLAEN